MAQGFLSFDQIRPGKLPSKLDARLKDDVINFVAGGRGNIGQGGGRHEEWVSTSDEGRGYWISARCERGQHIL